MNKVIDLRSDTVTAHARHAYRDERGRSGR